MKATYSRGFRVKDTLSLLYDPPTSPFAVVIETHKGDYYPELYFVLTQDWLDYSESGDWDEEGKSSGASHLSGVYLRYFFSEALFPIPHLPTWMEESLKKNIAKESGFIADKIREICSRQKYLDTLNECLPLLSSQVV